MVRHVVTQLASLFALSFSFAITAQAENPICVTDDIQQQLCLHKPAQRIVSLSPGATELLFSAGAGSQIVATVTFSDYPEQAKAIPRVGSYNRIDMESILAAKPDLIVAWKEGNPREQVAQLRQLGIAVYHGDQRNFDDIARTITRLGTLAGTAEHAKNVADNFLEQINSFHKKYQHAPKVRTFYQVWINPLMTANNQHFIGHAISLCGGENVFADLPRLTPRISKEAVLAANPEVIVAGGMGEDNPGWLDDWRPYHDLLAVRKSNLFFIPPSTLQRPSLRLLEGIEMLCEDLEAARGRR